ncbi:MAG: hypothetical protein R2836_08045, partial [Chitinophagales bacterium]
MKKVLLLFVGLFFSTIAIALKAQVSVQIVPTSPTAVQVCNDSTTDLRVRVSITAATTTGCAVSINLPTGVEYVHGTGTLVKNSSSPAALTVNYNAGASTPNVPVFNFSQNTLAASNYVEFTIKKTATCDARIFVLNGGNLIDSVSATVNGTSSLQASAGYTANYPSFAFTQPVAQNNAVVGGTYSRTFSVSNGAVTSSDEIFLTIDYGTGIQPNSLSIGATTLTPTSVTGSVYVYTITGTLLGADSLLTNGETITFTENYTVLQCNAVTNYSAGWGCSLTSICQAATGTGSVTMATGVPGMAFTATKTNYVNKCTPFNEVLTYTNSGTGNAIAATMFNTKFRLGGGNSSVL